MSKAGSGSAPAAPAEPIGRVAIRHFANLAPAQRAKLFHREPETIALDADRELVAAALGATLYVPATRPDLAATIARRARDGAVSMVIDLEDAIADGAVAAGERAITAALGELATIGSVPLLFVRVRDESQIPHIAASLGGNESLLTGFVLPKFEAARGEAMLRAVDDASARIGRRFYAMPILESRRVLYLESRAEELVECATILGRHRDSVLAVRIGATDMCGALGIRRDPDLTIYDVQVVSSAIASIANVLGRMDGTGFTLSGPVWEYYNTHERMFRTLLRATPFVEGDAVKFREHIVGRDLDGLLREIVLDRANGLLGKTVIHPSHVPVVHALSVVSHEEYVDALAVLENSAAGGVSASQYSNKMNEHRPHRHWANRTLLRARAFGVAEQNVTLVDLLKAALA